MATRCASRVTRMRARRLCPWTDGLLRPASDADRQPRTVTQRVAQLLGGRTPGHGDLPPGAATPGEARTDGDLLTELLTLLTRLEQDRVRLAEGTMERGGVAALVVVPAVVNSLVPFVTARCGDPPVLPSNILSR